MIKPGPEPVTQTVTPTVTRYASLKAKADSVTDALVERINAATKRTNAERQKAYRARKRAPNG